MTTAVEATDSRVDSGVVKPVSRPAARRRWLLGLLFVVALLAGLIQTIALFADDEPTPILRMNGPYLVATGVLNHTLHGGDTADGDRQPVVGKAFRGTDGKECRTFAARPAVDGPIAGTACLIEGDWRIVDLRQDVSKPALPDAPAPPADGARP